MLGWYSSASASGRSFGETFSQGLEHFLTFDARQRRAQAVVRARSKGDMLVRMPADVERVGLANAAGSRFADEMNQRTRSFLRSTLSAHLDVLRRDALNRHRPASRSAGTPRSPAWRARRGPASAVPIARDAAMNASVPLHSRLMVVSWPASSSSDVLTSTWWRVNTPAFSPRASTDMKSSPGLTMRSSTSGETIVDHPAHALGQRLHPVILAAADIQQLLGKLADIAALRRRDAHHLGDHDDRQRRR